MICGILHAVGGMWKESVPQESERGINSSHAVWFIMEKRHVVRCMRYNYIQNTACGMSYSGILHAVGGKERWKCGGLVDEFIQVFFYGHAYVDFTVHAYEGRCSFYVVFFCKL